MIVYAKFAISLHGLELKSDAELRALSEAIRQAVLSARPAPSRGLLDDDVEVELEETAGNATP